jgi:hypothetical protein
MRLALYRRAAELGGDDTLNLASQIAGKGQELDHQGSPTARFCTGGDEILASITQMIADIFFWKLSWLYHLVSECCD